MPFFSLVLSRPTGGHLNGIINERASEYILSDNGGRAFLRLHKRAAYPGTFCRSSSDGINFGYGDPVAAEGSEFLIGTLNGRGELSLRRDAFATLPLFYAEFHGKLHVSNDYAWLVASLPTKAVSPEAFAAALRDDVPMAATFVEGVSVLWPDEILTYGRDGVDVQPTHQRTWQSSPDAPATSPQHFYDGFEQYLDYFISSRLAGQQYAFEASGGLDSATLPQYIAHKQQAPLIMTALVHTDSQAAGQQRKLWQLQQRTNSAMLHRRLDSKTGFPLSRMVKQSAIWPTYFEKTYLEPTESYIVELASRGVRVLCTGVGGDELFGNVLAAPDNSRTPRSVRYGNLCNNTYIEHGIWPVSPFVDPRLYSWVQGLPVQHRANKNILRAYHQAKRFIADIYNPVHNETFTPFFTECFTSGAYGRFVQKLAANSFGERLGLVNLPLLLETYQRTQSETYPELDSDCFRIYLWMLAEINAQSVGAAFDGRPSG